MPFPNTTKGKDLKDLCALQVTIQPAGEKAVCQTVPTDSGAIRRYGSCGSYGRFGHCHDCGSYGRYGSYGHYAGVTDDHHSVVVRERSLFTVSI